MTTIPELPDTERRSRTMRATVLGAARPRPAAPRRVAWATRAATAAGVALLLALVWALPGGGTSDALAVTTTDGWLELRITDNSANADALTEELREAGIDGEVRAVPVPPSEVGKWAAMDSLPGPGARTDAGPPDDQAGGAGSVPMAPSQVVFFDRKDVIRLSVEEVQRAEGSLVIYIGRTAEAGEAYMFADGPGVPQP